MARPWPLYPPSGDNAYASSGSFVGSPVVVGHPAVVQRPSPGPAMFDLTEADLAGGHVEGELVVVMSWPPAATLIGLVPNSGSTPP